MLFLHFCSFTNIFFLIIIMSGWIYFILILVRSFFCLFPPQFNDFIGLLISCLPLLLLTPGTIIPLYSCIISKFVYATFLISYTMQVDTVHSLSQRQYTEYDRRLSINKENFKGLSSSRFITCIVYYFNPLI